MGVKPAMKAAARDDAKLRCDRADIMLPGRDGLSAAAGAREENVVPVIHNGAYVADERVEGLNLGADDYDETVLRGRTDRAVARVGRARRASR